MNYCNQKGIYCPNCNVRGYCDTTAGCIQWELTKSEPAITNTPSTQIEWSNLNINTTAVHCGRTCQICGKGTDSTYDYICSDCRTKLKKLMEIIND